MTTTIDQLAAELIARFHLHDNGAPVDLSPLEDLYRIRCLDLTGTGLRGFIRPSNRKRPTIAKPITIVLDRYLSPFERRLVYAHEVGHAVLGHEGTLRVESVSHYFDERQERDAWRFASLILIPEPVELIDWSVPAIAANCRVTPDMVAMWRALA